MKASKPERYLTPDSELFLLCHFACPFPKPALKKKKRLEKVERMKGFCSSRRSGMASWRCQVAFELGLNDLYSRRNEGKLSKVVETA